MQAYFKQKQSTPDISHSSSGNLEVDFVPKMAYKKVSEIEHKYQDFSKFYSAPPSKPRNQKALRPEKTALIKNEPAVTLQTFCEDISYDLDTA